MSDEEETYDPVAHKQLLKNINSLSKTQHIRKPTRNEPTLRQDEFHLIKSSTSEGRIRQAVAVKDIVDILKDTAEHINIGKKLKNVIKTKKVLEKPLEKPVIERIKRSVGFENVKKKLSRWDALVTKNRNAEQQVFPLKSETIYVNLSKNGRKNLALKSDLMKQMEEVDKKLATLRRQQKGDMDDPEELEEKQRVLLEKQLTREELEAKRKELAYLRMRQSEKSAKARMQNKIKSKKYHKLLKRQKLQKQLKEFELLQKTNPEAALEKLNAIEKARVLERASLRHKNTGTWARNLQVRAKYNKEVRKDLAEQLQKSRELTTKIKDMQSDNDEDNNDNDNDEMKNIEKSNGMEIEEEEEEDPFNPWVKVKKKSKDTAKGEEAIGNWRKYWLERNTNEKLLEEYNKMLCEGENDGKIENEKSVKEGNEESTKVDNLKKKVSRKTKQSDGKSNRIRKKKPITENAWVVEKVESVKKLQKDESDDVEMKLNGWKVEKLPSVKELNKTQKRKSKEEIVVDDIFDAGEERIREKLQRKLQRMNDKAKKRKAAKTLNKQKLKMRKGQGENTEKHLQSLTFQHNENKRPIIDEELINNEVSYKNSNEQNTDTLRTYQETLNSEVDNKGTKSQDDEHIDPNQVAHIKLRHNYQLNNVEPINDIVGDVGLNDEDEDENEEQLEQQRQAMIAEAFEDDDIIADFNKEKAADSELKNTELELTMPGWGNWAGPGISDNDNQQSSNKRKRLVLNLAPQEKRRDENKSNVYINETVSKHLRQHLVSDIPFPFKTQEDFESSIRAPIGRDFVTESSFRMLTRPSVITRKGQVIEPIDESELLKKPRRSKNPIDIRIALLNKT